MFARVEPGIISQGSIYLVLLFSFFLYYWKHLLTIFAVIFSVAIALYFSTSAHAIGMAPGGGCGTLCMANYNYYGTPYGNYGYYPYPSLPFHSLQGPTPYYFQPYGPSPYQPNDCIACMQRYQQFTAPMSFPNYYGSPGITKVEFRIPLLAAQVVQTHAK